MTLIEIMVVIAIIGILSTAIGFGVISFMADAKVDAAKAQIDTISQAVDIYMTRNGDFPSSLQELVEKKALKDKNLNDPWKQEIEYNYPSSRGEQDYDLCSKGPDKTAGSDDDICNE
jgi:general secretion pathway protein G